ncbi:MAG TPA: hypothetical protein VFS50_09120 [Meiothermus sp.]|jgi:pimeloyl-ACP methyl ester carboxylesterase|nr:hypothetical protein [Meiothermus sp.]
MGKFLVGWGMVLALSVAWGQADESDLYDCLPTDLKVQTLIFSGPDGTRLRGVMLGEGQSGVVFSNESGNEACRWIGFARTLVGVGYRVFLYTYGSTRREEDTTAAVAEMGRRGVKRIILVGASQGAKTSIIAASRKLPGVVAAVTLSAEEFMASQDIKPFAARLELPVLFVTAERDAFGANRAALLFYRLAPSKEKQLLVMPGSAHGTQLLKDAGLVRRVLGFINAHR